MRQWFGLALAAVLGLVIAGCGSGGGDLVTAPKVSTTLTVRTLNGTTPASAAWVAYQDGDGAWKTLAPKSAGIYSATIAAVDGRYGVAIAAPAGMQPAMTVYQGTLAEMDTIAHVLSPFSPGTLTLGGQFKGAVPNTDSALVALGTNVATSPLLTPYQLAFLKNGTYDVVAVRRKLSAPRIDKFFLQRFYALKANATLDIDFSDTAHAYTPNTFTITTPDMTGGTVMLRTFNGTMLPIAETPAGGTMAYAALPSTPGDRDDLYVASTEILAQSGVLQAQQRRIQAFHIPANRTLSLPATFNSPLVTEEASGRLTARWNTYANALAYNVKLAPTSGNQWSVWLSAGWLKPGTSYSYTLPELSQLTGWQAAWSPAGGDEEWTADAITGNRPLSALAAALASGTYNDGMEIGVSGMGLTRP